MNEYKIYFPRVKFNSCTYRTIVAKGRIAFENSTGIYLPSQNTREKEGRGLFYKKFIKQGSTHNKSNIAIFVHLKAITVHNAREIR